MKKELTPVTTGIIESNVNVLKERALKRLETVGDPEMPTVSLVDLGMVHTVDVYHEAGRNRLHVKLLPTFVGCPALDMMRREVEQALSSIEGVQRVTVEFIYTPKWTTDRMSERAKEKLKTYGIAPPPCLRNRDALPLAEVRTKDFRLNAVLEEIQMQSGPLKWNATCPFCGSKDTVLENPFGPTSCRSIFYCKTCKNPFEAMKPVG